MHDEIGEYGTSTEKNSINYEKKAEKYLSQYLQQENQLLYQKYEYTRLHEHYNALRSDLYNQKRTVGELNKNFNLVNKNLQEQKKLERQLEKENLILKNQIESYKKRKIVRLTNFIKMTLLKISSNGQPTKKPIMDVQENSTITTPNNSVVPMENDSNNEVKYLKDIKVAVILDEFSYSSFKYEFNTLELEPDNWRKIFQTETPRPFPM